MNYSTNCWRRCSLTPATGWLLGSIMSEYRIIKLTEKPEIKEKAANWFHEKWDIPLETYLQSMEAAINGDPVQEWYVCLDKEKIIAGMGVIENDFHGRKDLTPNICARSSTEAGGYAASFSTLQLPITGQKGSPRCICWQTILVFMKDMVGNFCAWFRGLEKIKRVECIFIDNLKNWFMRERWIDGLFLLGITL